jgi:hypothetical protein
VVNGKVNMDKWSCEDKQCHPNDFRRETYTTGKKHICVCFSLCLSFAEQNFKHLIEERKETQQQTRSAEVLYE